MFDSILVALWASGEARVGGAAGWIGTVDGPGFAGAAFGGGGGAFFRFVVHESNCHIDESSSSRAVG